MTSRERKALDRVRRAAIRLTNAVDALPAKDLPLMLRLTLSGAKLTADKTFDRLTDHLGSIPVVVRKEGD